MPDFDEEIIQILPVPFPMWAESVDGTNKFYSPIVCLALVDYGSDGRMVCPMSLASGDGYINSVQDIPNFSGIVYNEPAEW